MKVYVLQIEDGRESLEILGIYSSEEDALDAWRSYCKENPGVDFEEYYLTEYPLLGKSSKVF